MTVMTTSSNQPVQGRVVPRTQYIYVTPAQSGGGGGGGRWSRMVQGTSGRLGQHVTRVEVPRPLPQFLGSQRIIVYAWGLSMAIIAVDEWKRHEMLPRPSRLWWATLFYGMLAIGGIIPSLVPLMNALAVGYTIMLLWQFYNKEGQFS